MALTPNQVQGLVLGQYGAPVVLKLVDYYGNPINLSGYTGFSFILRDPWTLKSITYVASLFTNGVDGQFQFTPQNGDIDRIGTWEGQLIMTAPGIKDASTVAQFPIEHNLG